MHAYHVDANRSKSFVAELDLLEPQHAAKR